MPVYFDPQLPDGKKVRNRMKKFNASRMLESAIGKIGWLIVVMAALTLSFWSLYIVAIHYGLPWYLAAIVSCIFDGAAIVSADMALKYARASDSGLGPRMAVFILAGASAYLNAQHVILNHDPNAAIILYASPPIIAVLLFEMNNRYERRNALRRTGRVAKALPVFGHWAWFLFPFKSLKIMRGIVQRRLNQHDIEENEDLITSNIVLMAEARQVRAWAIQRGFSVGQKGRIPAEIMQAFQDERLAIEAKKDHNLSIINDNVESPGNSEDNAGETGA